MDTKPLRDMGLQLLMQSRPVRADVATYVQAVNDLIDANEANDQVQKAFENSMKQVHFIFETIDKLRGQLNG